MTKETPTWDENAPQPFSNQATVYTYIPRANDQPLPTPVQKVPAQPINYHPVHYQPVAYYPVYNYTHTWYQYHDEHHHQLAAQPQQTYYYPQQHYYQQPQVYYQPAQPQPEPQKPAQLARLPDGTIPWYGRTRDEVQYDEWRTRDKYEKKNFRKDFEPKGKPGDMYWVQHKDGGCRNYPLGTIKNNFEGEWKMDVNGYPYLVET